MEKQMLLEDHVRKNKRDTVLICIFMVVLLFSVIFAIGLALGAPPYFTMAIALPIALFYIMITYSFSVQTVISAAGARPANPQVREEKMLIYKAEEMAIAAGLPPPKVYVQDSKDINAFATGKKPEESIICATTGAIRQLNNEELEGVIGHEMSHIKNRDILVMTVTVAVVGTIAILAEIALRSLLWGGGGRESKKGGGGIVLIIVAIIFIVLAPLFSRLTYLAISRRREYLADADGAYLTRNPDGLAAALEKIKNDLPDDPKGSKTVAPLYIANPYKRALRNSIWSTHPPLDERIRRLRSM
ncbi:MAG: M48 family metallopeptidase [Methanocellales archaeon]|nr:M48 family metallopeptidase [Methanocellales archaeon]MDD4898488.1 M48 family metallopeptidase [Methanocellales archaeon]